MTPRRYIYLNHWDDRFEVLVAGSTILRIHKCFADSGMIREVRFEDLPDGLRDQLMQEVASTDYEI